MLIDDDTEPRKKKATQKILDKMSLDELRSYIEDLKAEIERAEGEIARKDAHMAAMTALFKQKE
jgi:uncharacterized small protein (DUF1192 family)